MGSEGRLQYIIGKHGCIFGPGSVALSGQYLHRLGILPFPLFPPCPHIPEMPTAPEPFRVQLRPGLKEGGMRFGVCRESPTRERSLGHRPIPVERVYHFVQKDAVPFLGAVHVNCRGVLGRPSPIDGGTGWPCIRGEPTGVGAPPEEECKGSWCSEPGPQFPTCLRDALSFLCRIRGCSKEEDLVRSHIIGGSLNTGALYKRTNGAFIPGCFRQGFLVKGVFGLC